MATNAAKMNPQLRLVRTRAVCVPLEKSCPLLCARTGHMYMGTARRALTTLVCTHALTRVSFVGSHRLKRQSCRPHSLRPECGPRGGQQGLSKLLADGPGWDVSLGTNRWHVTLRSDCCANWGTEFV